MLFPNYKIGEISANFAFAAGEAVELTMSTDMMEKMALFSQAGAQLIVTALIVGEAWCRGMSYSYQSGHGPVTD